MLSDAAIRRRRQKKIREIKSRTNRYSLMDNETRNDRQRFEEAFPRYGGMGNSLRPNPNWSKSLSVTRFDGTRLTRWIIAAVIVFLSFITFNIPYFQNEKVQSFIVEVMERDFNFEGVAVWYEDKFGASLNLIPAFQSRKIEAEKVKSNSWAVPVAGMSEIPPFKEEASLLASAPGSDVYATEGGWVTQVNAIEGSGYTVVIQHSTDTESTYSLLGDVRVEKNDWVSKGQLIGTTKEDKLYFSIQKSGQYVDPSGVIFID